MKIATHKIFLYFFLLLYSFSAYTQNKLIDSLLKVLQTQKEDSNKVITLGLVSDNFIYNGDYKNAMQYANEALSLAEKLYFKKGEAGAYTNIGAIYGRLYNWPEARKKIFAALRICEESGDKPGMAGSYIRIAGTYNGEGNDPEALKNTYTALKLYEELKDKKGIAYSYLMIGGHYFNQGDNSEALKTFLMCLKLQEEIGDKYGSAQSYGIIGEIYYRQGNYSEALKNDSAALKLHIQIDEKRGVAYILQNIGEIDEKEGTIAFERGDQLTSQNKFHEARKNYLSSLKLSQDVGGSKFSLGSAYVHLGNINIKLKKYSEARDFLEKGIQLSTEINDKETQRDSYSSLSNLDSIQGNYKQAYEHYKMYILYRDSLVNEESKKKSLQTTMQYEFDKKEAVAKAEQEKKDVETKRIKNLQYFAIGGLGIVVLAVLLIAFIQWRNNKHKQRANVLLTQQKEKVESTLSELKATQTQLIQSEKMASLGELTAGIAHEIQNPLNFVNNFSEVNKELLVEMKDEMDKGNYDDAKALASDVIDNEEKINHHGKRADAIVKGMLQHSRSGSGVKEPTDINALADEYLRLAYHGLRAKDKSFNATMKTDFDESIGNINIIPQDIGRAILNLITNAFYAVTEKKKQQADGYEPTVSVSTKKVGDKVSITVKDNGMGIPQKVLDKIFQPFFTTKPTGQGTGLGLSLAYDIVKAHGGELKVEMKEARPDDPVGRGKGAEFVIHLPLLHT